MSKSLAKQSPFIGEAYFRICEQLFLPLLRQLQLPTATTNNNLMNLLQRAVVDAKVVYALGKNHHVMGKVVNIGNWDAETGGIILIINSFKI